MKDSVDRVVQNGVSVVLFQLAQRIGNSASRSSVNGSSNQQSLSGATTGSSMNLLGMTHVVNAHRRELCIADNDDFYTMDAKVEALEVKSGLCNVPEIRRWNITLYTALQELVVGDDCLQHVENLSLTSLRFLTTVSIGSNCFTVASGGRFEVSHCNMLQSVLVGSDSFCNWSSFVAKDCAVLSKLRVDDGCFIHCESTVVEGGSLGLF